MFGRRIITNDEGDVEKAREIARAYAEKLNVIAVVGHFWSIAAIPASVIYEKNGILFISHGAANPELIRNDTRFIFRNIPSDEDVGHDIANFADPKGL